MDERDRKLLGLDEYFKELSRIVREMLPAGAKRDYDRMIELAKEFEQLAIDERGERGGNPDGNPAQ